MKKNVKGSRDQRTLMVRIICIVLCAIMVGGLLTSALMTFVSAASSSQIKKELDRLKDEANKIAEEGQALEKELAANEAEQTTTIEEKSAIDRRIQVTESEIRNANAQIQQYSLLIAEKQTELEEAQAKQEELNKRYKLRLRAMEETGSLSYWSVLFEANSFSDLLSRIDSINEVAEADQRMLGEMKVLAEEIAQSRKELEADLAEQEEAKTALEELEASLLEQRSEADALLIELAEEYNSLSEVYLANEAEEDALRKQIMEAQASYEKALSAEEAARLKNQNKGNAAGGAASGGSSGFVYPLPAGTSYVSCSYGPRTHPLWGYQSFHYGVDLAAGSNTPVYAIASGTVTLATYGDANGYYISMSHGNGYGSVYCHLNSFAVKAGDYVSQGQVIGYVGSTGWSTGPHLHFEIHVNGSAVNPMNYVSVK